MMIIENKFNIGDTVYIVTDEDQKKRVVTGLRICPRDCIIYYLNCGTVFSEHYDFELQSEENVLAKTI